MERNDNHGELEERHQGGQDSKIVQKIGLELFENISIDGFGI